MSTTAARPEVQAVPRSAWLALLVTTVVFFLTVVDVSAVNVAFPSIREDFAVSNSELSWIISGYNITVATGLLLAGRLADSIGRKRVFMPGVVIFMLGSLLSGVAPSVNMLIAARVVQAVGGAVVAASSLAVVLPDFPLSKRSTVIGIAGATAGLGAVAGPAVGSVLIEGFGWRSIFLLNVPLCLLILALSPRLLRESKDPNARGRVDLLGIPIGTAAIALIMFAIVQSESWGLTDGRIIALLVIGLALVPLLIWRSARHPEPLLDLTLFKISSFASANAGAAFYFLRLHRRIPGRLPGHPGDVDQPLAPPVLPCHRPRSWPRRLAPGGTVADRFGHRWLLGFGSSLSGSPIFLPASCSTTPADLHQFVPINLFLGIGIGLSISSWSSAGLSDIGPAEVRHRKRNGADRPAVLLRVGYRSGRHPAGNRR